jgi:hypothetical protein
MGFKRILKPEEVEALERDNRARAQQANADARAAKATTQRTTQQMSVPSEARRLINDSLVPGESKEWAVWTAGTAVFTRWGRVGTKLKTTRKELGTETNARFAMNKMVRLKKRKGYKEAR